MVDMLDLNCSERLKLQKGMSDPVLHRWMTNLDLHARNHVPIIYLAIPGSNSSMSYSLRWKSLPAPVVPLFKRVWYFIVGKLAVRRWKTQNFNIYGQLQSGVRYFELQICKKTNNKNPIHGFYFCHGRYCHSVIEPLIIIKKYLETYSREFVILDFRKFYRMNRFDHDTLQDFLFTVFGKLIYGPRDGFLVELTLSKATAMKKQVLIIYRDDNCWENTWPDCCWPILSVKIDDIEDLCGALEAKLKRRQPGIGCITEYVYTPKWRKRLSAPISRSCIALDVFSRIKEWIPKQSAGLLCLDAPRINIITSDYIETHDSAFCKDVVKLNDWALQIIQNDLESCA